MDQIILVRKASGELEPFSAQKVRQSLLRAGANPEMAQRIIRKLKTKLYNGISTREIYRLVFDWLGKEHTFLPSRYQLKQAIFQLGPSGYPFEKFFAGILQHRGWQTTTNQIFAGRCTTHEIDVVAQKNNEKILVECKFHPQGGTKTDVQAALVLWARFSDLKDNRQFTQAWLVTNSKLTTRAIDYCECVGIKPISWNYKGEWSLRELVESSQLHPITTLVSLTNAHKQDLLARGIVFCHQLQQHLEQLPRSTRSQVAKELRFVLGKSSLANSDQS